MDDYPAVSRRRALFAGGVCFAMLSQRAFSAEGRRSPVITPNSRRAATFSKDSETAGVVEMPNIHSGDGNIMVKFFQFDQAAVPENFLIYELPPGASEGVHVHFLDNRNNEGSFDEYYYVISGQGHMEIDGQVVPVAAGDHVHTPLGVAHGLENTHDTDNLRVLLTFVRRGSEA